MGNRYAPFLIVAAAAALLTTPIYAQGPQGIVPFLLQPNSPQAQIPCGLRASLVSQLEKKYGEAQTAVGMQGQYIIEVWTSPETQSFTIIKSRADGVSCIISAGEAFQTQKPETPDTPT